MPHLLQNKLLNKSLHERCVPKSLLLLPNPVSTPRRVTATSSRGQHRDKVKVTLATAEINKGRKGKNKHTHTKKKPLEKLSRAVVSQRLPGKRKELPHRLTLCSHTCPAALQFAFDHPNLLVLLN